MNKQKKDNEILEVVTSAEVSSADEESKEITSTKSSSKKIDLGQDEHVYLAELFSLVQEKSFKSNKPIFVETEFQKKFGRHISYKTLQKKYLCQSNTAKNNKKSTPKRTSSNKSNIITSFEVPSPESK
jgi:hypothetical protein